VKSLDPIFKALCPGVQAADRTPGRTGEPAQAEYGYLHCGPTGAGHFVKMIHNGIEYGMMAAVAEGLAIFEAADEMTPAYDLDIPEITEVWRRGSVVASWLLDLTAQALNESNELTEYSTEVSDSGEGRWTVQAAIEAGIPAHVLSASLYSRFASRNNDEFANRVLSAMRYKFGGHNEKPQSSADSK
jgi:6-phosphogluconate dehydrogenase